MKKLFLIITAGLLILSGQAQQRQGLFAGASQADDAEAFRKLTQFVSYLNQTYVDTLNMGQLVDAAIVEMLSKLDPHSAYVSAEEMKEVQENFSANFEGIGIEFNVLNDTIIVVNTIAGGPSEKVGLLPNDRIVTADGRTIVGTKQTDVPKILRGPKGSVIDLGVIRRGISDPLSFRIERDKIPLHTVDASYKVDGHTGYVRVNRFAATTYSELQQAILGMGAIDALILDLRGNGGGYLDQAVYVSNAFLPKGSLVVSTEGLRLPPERLETPQNPIFGEGKVIVLVDEYSASASEIVAGAIQDWDRGVVVGRPTFGKGLVQRQLPLIDGSAVRITVARYHTPTGRVIQRPYENGKTEDYYMTFARRFNADSLQTFPDSLKYRTLRSGRTVYGGGGITPDVLVSRDTTWYSEYWGKLRGKGIINEFVVDYMDKNRAALVKSYPDFESFDRGFAVDQSMLDALVQFGEKRGEPYSAEGMQKSGAYISTQLKALVAQKMWTMTEYFRVVNHQSDEFFTQAAEVLDHWEQYNVGILDGR
jgi:carboxyl-terminal processing protease